MDFFGFPNEFSRLALVILLFLLLLLPLLLLNLRSVLLLLLFKLFIFEFILFFSDALDRILEPDISERASPDNERLFILRYGFLIFFECIQYLKVRKISFVFITKFIYIFKLLDLGRVVRDDHITGLVEKPN